MITYLFTSSLLSAMGWLLYRSMLKKAGTWQQRKRFLYLMLLTSLLLPLGVLKDAGPVLRPVPRVQPLAFGQAIDHGSVQQYCRCENPDLTHRLRYRTNGYYNFLLSHKHWLTYGVGVAVLGVLLVFGLQLIFLHRLVRRSPKESVLIKGQEWQMIIPERPRGIGAFWLGKPYLIWQEPLNPLTTKERNAILAHEWSHLRQRNTQEKAILRLLQCLWFFNPVFYWVRKELELISEFIADHAGSEAMEGKQSYASLLLKLQAVQTPACTSGLTGSTLRKRIEALLNPPLTRPGRLLLVGGLMIVLQWVLVTPISAQITQAIDEFHTYETIYHQAPQSPEVIYCPDCETVCTPDGEEILLNSEN